MANSQRRNKQRLLLLPATEDGTDVLRDEAGNYITQLIEIDVPYKESCYLDLSKCLRAKTPIKIASDRTLRDSDLCILCSTFLSNLQLANFGMDGVINDKRWKPINEGNKHCVFDLVSGHGTTSTRPHIDSMFEHYAKSDDLEKSANKGCSLCGLVTTILKACDSIEHDLSKDSTSLHFIPTRSLVNNTVSRDFRSLTLRIQTLQDDMVAWVDIRNTLEFTRTRQSLELVEMTPAENAGPSLEELLEEPGSNSEDDGRKQGDQFDSDMKFDVSEQIVGPDTLSISSRWLDICASEHPLCASSQACLPTRVIDVGLSDRGHHICLFESGGMIAKYAALSYCWGANMPVKLTKGNLAEFQETIKMETLPTTLQDAIELTRHLMIPYLWIDALCIVQDSLEDWEREASRMMGVYEGSTLTISALRAEDVDSGLRSARLGYKVSMPVVRDDRRHYGIREPYKDLETTLRQSKINSRGWCFQERILSSRILHIGQEQNFWECREAICSENGTAWPSVATLSVSFPEFSEHQAIKRWLYSQEHPKFETQYRMWYSAVELYSRLCLTFEKDRLAAISGIAQKFQSNGAGQYCGGLWHQDILAGLHWVPYSAAGFKHHMMAHDDADNTHCEELSRSNTCVAPSWSWASVRGRVRFLLDGRPDERILRYSAPMPERPEFFSCVVLGIENDNPGADLFVSKAALRLRAFCANVHYLPPDGDGCCGMLLLGSAQDPSKVFSISGCVMDTDRKQRRPCECVLLYCRDRKANDGPGAYATFLVVEYLDESDTYRRIGLCYTLLDTTTFDIRLFTILSIRIE